MFNNKKKSMVIFGVMGIAAKMNGFSARSSSRMDMMVALLYSN